MSLPGLPADLQYELLSYLPDFSALNSLILTSRSLHAVFRTRRVLVLKTVADNFLGIALGEEIIGDSTLDPETDDSNISGTIKFLVGTRAAIEALEPIVFRLLVHQDVHWDDPNRWSVLLTRLLSDIPNVLKRRGVPQPICIGIDANSARSLSVCDVLRPP